MEEVKFGNEFDSYNDYISLEWEKFEKNRVRYKPLLDATKPIKVERILDIGCGAGQEMLPFVENGAFGVGIDVTPFVGQVGRKKYTEKGLQNQIGFANASGDNLPFADESFNAIICRGALMFMNVNKALSEFSRVLAKNGRLILMIQAPNYYWWKTGMGLKRVQLKTAIHASRVLLSGMWFSISGKQSYSRLTAAGETYVSRKMLERGLKENGMEIISEMPDTNTQTPSFLIVKK